jgi:uncharacterized membrane protein YfcA
VTLDPLAIIALVAIISLAAFVNGTIGFGFALLAVNALALFLDAKNGVIAMSLISPIVSGIQVWHHRERSSLARRLRTMLLGGLVGTALGTQLLVLLPPTAISTALGAFTVWFVFDSLRVQRPPLAGSTQRWLGPVAGLIGGISNGALGASGPVFGTYLTAIGLRTRDFGFAISIAFFTMAVMRVGLLTGLGQYTLPLVGIGLALAVPSILAQYVGLWFKGRLPAETLYRGVLVFLFLAGANLLVRSALDILRPAAGG